MALLISNRGTRMLLQAVTIFFAGVLPVAAQGIPQNPTPVRSHPSPLADPAALSREALVWLAQLIQINTTNPPGNEQAAAKYVAAVLEKEGITPEVLEVAPGRGAVVARLRSSAISDPSRALLLVAHMDVVGADRARWTVDPFGAVMKDGYMYGRGALDDKSMLAANLATIIALKRSNARLNRDVIFLATDDEEAGGEASIKTLLATNWDKFAAGFALNDGRERSEHAQRGRSEANPQWGYMMRDSIAPTMLSAGVRANVIPGEARAMLNIRLLPGDTIDVLLGALSKLVNDPQVRFEVQPNAGLAAPTSSLESDFYAVINKVASQEFGGAPVLPYQSPWATDSSQLRLHNVQAYGLWPFPVTDEDLKRMHGDDERLSVASFNKGVQVLLHIVSDFAVTK